jgi:hypothetical protein
MVALRCCLAVLVFGACSVGEVGGADGGMVTMGTRAGFDATIKPMVMTKGCVSCHSALQPPNFTSYDTLLPQYRNGPPETNKLLTEAADGALHNGVTYFTTAEKMTVRNWILGM